MFVLFHPLSFPCHYLSGGTKGWDVCLCLYDCGLWNFLLSVGVKILRELRVALESFNECEDSSVF